MLIYVLRHGQAEPQLTTDEARNLTAIGRLNVTSMVTASLDDLLEVEQIWASPLVRAQQTAKIAQQIIATKAPPKSLVTTDLIVPEANPEQLFFALQNSGLQSVLLVSHQPLVSELFDRLCGSTKGFHSFGTSSIGCVECNVVAAGLAQLHWLRHVSE